MPHRRLSRPPKRRRKERRGLHEEEDDDPTNSVRPESEFGEQPEEDTMAVSQDHHRQKEEEEEKEKEEENEKEEEKPGVIFILDNAPLKKGLVRKKWKILNSEEDADLLVRQNKNLDDYHPSIFHEALLSIFDSPLNKAGIIRAVYVKIDDGALFEIKPHVRIPRTCKRLCGIILELLEKSRVRSKDNGEILLRIIEEPVTRHLPANSRIIGLSHDSEKLVHVENYMCAASDELNLVFVIQLGAAAKSNFKDYTDDRISISQYPLAARCCLGLICQALEDKWRIF